MIRLSKVFSDFMVIQRDSELNVIWGYTDQGKNVKVSLLNSDLGEEAFSSTNRRCNNYG